MSGGLSRSGGITEPRGPGHDSVTGRGKTSTTLQLFMVAGHEKLAGKLK